MTEFGLDLRIAGRRAIVCGSTKGLGFACAVALARAGVETIINGRSQASVDAAVKVLGEQTGRSCKGIVADVTTSDGREALAESMPSPDIVVTNAAGPPPGHFEEWGSDEWMAALNANMVSPILLIRKILPGMQARRWGRIINITSAAVKSPLPLLGLSNGARTGLTGVMAGLARDVAADGVTINNLLPGHFATDRLRSYAAASAKDTGADPDAAWDVLAAANPTGKIGRPEDFGAVCAFFASDHAAYITGQNILMDGGAYRGTL